MFLQKENREYKFFFSLCKYTKLFFKSVGFKITAKFNPVKNCS